MSNELYAFARERFLSGQIDWTSNTVKVLLVNTADYVVAIDAHRHLTDILPVARIATSGPLTGKTAAGGVALADDVTINSVVGPLIGAIVLYHDSGDATTSELICYLDTGIGLPWNPQGANVVIHWSRGPDGIFTL